MSSLGRRVFVPAVLSLIFFAVSTQFAPPARSQANVTGQWQTLPYTTPINPIHAALLRNGKVLIVSGSGNVPTNTTLLAAIWDPQAGTVTTQPVAWDMFCSGMVVLPDGRPFIVGGTLQYDPFLGESHTATYDLTTGTFTDQQLMSHGRWYPTATVLGDGRVMVFSGLLETGATNTTVEIYNPSSGWSAATSAPWTPPLYPRLHVLPNGTVFYSGSGVDSSIFTPSTNSWVHPVATTNFANHRTYGSSVLLPLTPANNFTPKVMILGGSNPSTATTEIIDLSVANPTWVFGPSMSQPRIEMNATLLPNGKVLALGGSLNDEDTSTASLNADLYDPNSNTFSAAGTEAFERLYHSISLLMPDGTVMVAGGNPVRGTYEPHIEIYSPAYLFNSDGSLATRPTITSLSSSQIGYGGAFTVTTPDAANISSVVVMKNGAVTHAFNMDQRLVGLNFTKGSGVLNVTAPANGNLAPPGYYMVFILNAAGVPSVAAMVQISSTPGDIPPTGTITSPASDVTINAGQSVSYAGSGNDPDGSISSFFWSFTGGNPTTSNLANPGAVVYPTGGTYTTTLTVTDNLGVTDPHPPSRTITVNALPDFSLSVSPTSRAITQGGATTYTVTSTAIGGFAGTVSSFTVVGLPAGATASFNPTSIPASGSTTMTISTLGTTPAGGYTLTVGATSGTFSHTATTSFAVSQSSGASTINFSSGFSATGLQFNGHTLLNGTRLQLTDTTAPDEAASAFWTTPVNIQSFTNNFTFQLTNPAADGFTFTIQNEAPTALGQNGGLLGYAGATKITPSVAVKFDLANNDGEGNNSTGLYTDGAPPTVPATTFGGGVNLHSGDVFQVQMTYDGTTLTMTITDMTVPADTFTVSFPINIPATVGGNTAFVGFTAGTGTLTATQEILTWLYNTGTATLAATPVISPATGSFTSPQTVSITDSTPGATIFYTLDGSVPMTSSTKYGGSFVVSATTTVNAIATATNFSQSATGTSVIVIQGSGTPQVNFASGFTATGMQFNGNTVLNGTRLQLTNAAATKQASSAFWTTPVNVQSFTNNFTFQLTSPTADGFTFTIQNAGPTALGQNGGLLGYAGTTKITPSVTVKFDLANNSGEGNNSTGLYTDGAAPTVPATTFGGGVNLHSGDIFQVQMVYDGTTLTMTITDTKVPADTFTISFPINIPSTVGANTALVGFTGGTGGLSATQEILTWTYSANGLATPDFSISASPASQTVSPGNSTAYTITVGGLNGFSGAVALSVTGLPADSGVVFSPATVTGSGTSTMTVTPSLVSPTGTSPLTITGTSGSLTHSTTSSLVIAGTPDFSLSTSPASQTVNQGSSTTYTVTVSPQNSFAGTVTLSASGLPTGAAASFLPTSVTGSGTSTMTVTTSSTTPAATSTLTATGTSGSLTHSATSSLIVVAGTPDFSFSTSPASQTVNQGSSTTYTATIGVLNGFAGTVTLAASGLPTGATASFLPTSVTGSGTSTMTVTTSSTTPLATSILTVTGTSGGLTHSATSNLVVVGAPDFSISTSPASQTVNSGNSTTYTVTIGALNGFAGTVALSASGLPTGATASFLPTSVTGSGTSTMTVATSSTTPAATSTLTVTGTNGSLTHSATSSLIVQSGGGGTTPVNFASGFSAAGLQFNGTTVLNGTRLQLTSSAATKEAGSAFWTTPVNVQSFTNKFTFQLTNPAADGFTFTIQNAGPTALGGNGGLLGYAGATKITPSVAVKFDLANNSGEGNNSTGLYTDGAAPTVPATTFGGGVNLHSGDIFQVQMVYDGTTLTMTITDTKVPADTFTISFPINIPSTVGANTALVGFTGGTGGLTSTQEILTWTYSTGGTATPDFSISAAPGSQTVTAGNPTTYTVTIGAQNGFTGTVTLGASGLPSGASASFSPPTVTTSGTSTMTVTTGSATPAATSTLTITGTSNALTHSTTSSLTVQTGGSTTPVNFATGFSATGMQFNGTTVLNGTRLQLTNAAATKQAASAFWTTPVNVQSFTNKFTFQLTSPAADGFTFTIQNAGATALGGNGGLLGYAGATKITPSVAVKFDLANNAGEGNNSTGLYTNGASPSTPATTLAGGVNLHSGDIFQVQMTYDGTTLTMVITDTAVPADTFTIAFPIDIPTTVGGSTALVGFTGGTGALTSTQEILTWTYSTP